MTDIKTIIGIITVVLSIVAYFPYLKDIFKGKTKPHIYSWFIWGLLTSIIFGLQISAGAGAGSWVTLTVAILSFVVFFLGLRQGNKDITKTDKVFLFLAIIALLLWLVAKKPTLSVILAVSIDIFGFAPTIRKSWHSPFSETLLTYQLNAFRHGLSLLALQQYNLITWLNPVVWTLANGLFSLMLVLRRRQVHQ